MLGTIVAIREHGFESYSPEVFEDDGCGVFVI